MTFLKNIRLPILQLLHESRQAELPKLRMLISQLFLCCGNAENEYCDIVNPLSPIRKENRLKINTFHCRQSAGDDTDIRRILDIVPDLFLNVP